MNQDGQRLVLCTALLLAVGLAVLFSASFHDGGGDPFYFLLRQGAGVVLGGALFAVALCVDPRRLLGLAPWLLGGLVLLLAWVWLAGVEVKGSSRWLRVGPLRFQPSELAKVIIPFAVAWLADRVHSGRWTASRPLIWCGALGVLGTIAGLIALEPDYGTGLFVLAVGGILLLIAGMPFRYPLIAAVPLAPVMVAFLQWRGDVVAKRLVGLLDPMESYQVRHSLTAIGSGGLWGKGFGLGWEKANYLPEHFNDFIFAAYAEETGFVGVLVLMTLYSAFLWAGWGIARRCLDFPMQILAAGLVGSVVFQAAINIAVATASAPTKGIALPFLSHGSSGLTVLLLSIGIVLSISKNVPSREPAPEADAEDAPISEAIA